MAITKKALENKEKLVEKIFEKKNVDYKEWLSEQLDDIITDNIPLISEGLQALGKETKKENRDQPVNQNQGGQ